MLHHIRLFRAAGKSRNLNDIANRNREDVLCLLHSPPEDYMTDSEYGDEWKQMNLKWTSFLKTMCPFEFDTIQVKKIANLQNYDLKIEYNQNNQLIHTVFGEFKHNCKTISKLPQYYSAPEKKGYIPVRYSEFFYDNYVDRLCELTKTEKIDKDTYMKYIYQPKYSVHPFFQALKDSEETCYKQKQTLVRDSIRSYLEQYSGQLDLHRISEDLSHQEKKTFILWDCHAFHADTIRPEELQLEKIEGVLRNNTIVVVSKAGTKHKLLLRWRNHLGVLYPAWQISLER